MWWVKGNSETSRGGFQNRDVGRSDFDRDFGPEFGVDYARYSDPPDLSADYKLTEKIKSELPKITHKNHTDIDVYVRNGFVFLKGEVSDSQIKQEISDFIIHLPSVREVINQLHSDVDK